ncbi:hypothetical protein SAMN05216533_8313 [Streptomyces sp. Ag109_O5-10]|nr:hypothetical protein SAMN05216533_8313 [Streptomyces sp. Ag109_O5-10]
MVRPAPELRAALRRKVAEGAHTVFAPLRDLFAAIFFVFCPAALAEQPRSR